MRPDRYHQGSSEAELRGAARRSRLLTWLGLLAWTVAGAASLLPRQPDGLTGWAALPQDTILHLVLWLLGAGGIALASLAVRRRMEALAAASGELARSRGRLELATAGCGTGLWEWDIEDDRLLLDDTVAGFLGCSRGTRMPFAALREVLHPADWPAVALALEACRAGVERSFKVECRAREAARTWRWLHVRGLVTERGGAGAAVRVSGTCLDVTERRLLREQMVASERLAALGTLAAGMAHEMAGPLCFLTSNLALAHEALERYRQEGDAAAPGEAQEALHDAAEGARRVRGLLDDVRMLARPRTALEATDVRRVVQAAIGIARPMVAARAVLEVELEPLEPIDASADRLSQVLINLLVNAAQAIPEGARPGVIRVVARSSERQAVLEVSDTGAGISPEVLPRIFDPFFTTKEPGAGTGLGLAISQGIVHAMGGTIEVESEVGRGTTFRVRLPLRQARGSAAEGPRQAAAPRA